MQLLLAALSGFIGAIVLTLLIYLVKINGRYLDIPYMTGSRFVGVDNTTKTYTVGIALHLLIGAAWGVLYVILITALAVIPDWPTGILWGFAHGVFIGCMLEMLAENHPYVGEGKPISEPGIMGRKWGTLMPYWILFIHMVFGVCTLTIYNWLAY